MIFGGLAMLLFLALWVGGLVVWIVAIVDVARIPDYQFRSAGTEKIVWVLIVALTSFIGALIWFFAKRQAVHAFDGTPPLPPPGWYPDTSGGLQWWDGTQWTQHRHAPPTS